MSQSLDYKELEQIITPKSKVHDAKNDKSMMNSLIKMGSTGFFPLFFDEWLESTKLNNKKRRHLPYKTAKNTVKQSLEKLSNHKNLDRKRLAMLQWKESERQQFIQSFMRVVEFDILDNLKELH